MHLHYKPRLYPATAVADWKPYTDSKNRGIIHQLKKCPDTFNWDLPSKFNNYPSQLLPNDRNTWWNNLPGTSYSDSNMPNYFTVDNGYVKYVVNKFESSVSGLPWASLNFGTIGQRNISNAPYYSVRSDLTGNGNYGSVDYTYGQDSSTMLIYTRYNDGHYNQFAWGSSAYNFYIPADENGYGISGNGFYEYIMKSTRQVIYNSSDKSIAMRASIGNSSFNVTGEIMIVIYPVPNTPIIIVYFYYNPVYWFSVNAAYIRHSVVAKNNIFSNSSIKNYYGCDLLKSNKADKKYQPKSFLMSNSSLPENINKSFTVMIEKDPKDWSIAGFQYTKTQTQSVMTSGVPTTDFLASWVDSPDPNAPIQPRYLTSSQQTSPVVHNLYWNRNIIRTPGQNSVSSIEGKYAYVLGPQSII